MSHTNLITTISIISYIGVSKHGLMHGVFIVYNHYVTYTPVVAIVTYSSEVYVEITVASDGVVDKCLCS